MPEPAPKSKSQKFLLILFIILVWIPPHHVPVIQRIHSPKRVMVAVVGGLELDVHQVDGGRRRADEEDLHNGVVYGDEVREEV